MLFGINGIYVIYGMRVIYAIQSAIYIVQYNFKINFSLYSLAL